MSTRYRPSASDVSVAQICDPEVVHSRATTSTAGAPLESVSVPPMKYAADADPAHAKQPPATTPVITASTAANLGRCEPCRPELIAVPVLRLDCVHRWSGGTRIVTGARYTRA